MAKLPNIERKRIVRVICEGDEDFAYFSRLLKLGVWSDAYKFCPTNAKSASNIPAKFQNDFQNDRYDVILVFCDTDRAPHNEYLLVKQKINGYLNKKKASERLIIFANPCTMQIILSHFGDVQLQTQSKKKNAPEIERLTGIKNYGAHEDQIEELCSRIFKCSYPDMRNRIKDINFSDDTLCSTNFFTFLERFENSNTHWIDEIRKYLEN